MRTAARVIAASTTSLLLVGLAPGIAHAAGATRSSESPAAGSVISALSSGASISATFTGQTIAANSPATPLTFAVAAPGNSTSFACGTPAVSAPTADTISCTTSDPAPAGYPDGLYTVTYSFTSVPAGPSSGSFTFVLDASATPTGLVITPSTFTASTSAATPISVTGSALAGTNVAVTLTSSGDPSHPVTNSTVPVASDGSFSTSFSNTIADGTLTATAREAGAGSTFGPVSPSATATKDTALPTVSSTNPVEGGSERSTNGVTNNGISAVASEALKSGAGGSTITLVDSHGSPVAVTVDVASTSITATPTTVLAQGTYTATINLVDAVGNAGVPVTHHFTVDDTAPAAPSFNTPSIISKANQVGYVVSGTGEPGATLALSLKDAPVVHTVTGSTTVLSSGASAGTWQVTVDASSLNDGTIAFSATQTDGAGNTSPANGGTSVTKDTVSPVVSAVTFDKAAYKAGDTTAVVSGSVDNGASTPVAEADPVTVTVTDSGTGTGTGSGTAGVDGVFHVSVPISSLADGALHASVVARDPGLNQSLPATASSTKDTGLPMTPTVTATNPINAANRTVVLITGVTEPAAHVSVSIDDANNPATVPVVVPATADASTGSYSISSVDVSSLSDGVLTFSAVAQDAAGNSSGTGTYQATKDTVAPGVPTVTLPSAVNAANKAAVPVSGSAEPGSTVTITATDTTTPTALTYTKTVVATGGTYSTTLDLQSLKDGSLAFTVFATDPAGNPGGAVTPTPTLTKDVVAPYAPINLSVSPSPLDYAHRTSDVTVSGTAAVADQNTAGLLADVTLVDTDSSTADVVVSGVPVDTSTGAFSTVIPNAAVLTLTDSTLQVRVAIRDAAGNQGPSAVPTLVKDVTKLAVVSRSPAAATQSASSVVVTLNEALVTGTSSASPPYSAISVKNNLNNAVPGALQFSNSDKTLTFTPSGAFTEAASPYTVTLHATDVNDTNDVVDTVTTFVVDATAPVTPTITSVTNPVTAANKGAVSVSGNAAESDLTVTVTVTGTSGTPVTKSATSTSGGAYTVSGLDVSGLADGVLSVVASSADAAGNVSPSSATSTTTKDATAPVVSPLAATATDYAHPLTTVSGSVSEPVGATVALSATDGAHTVTGTAPVAGDRSFSGTLDTVTFNGGQFTVTVTATDAVGNVGTASVTTTHDAATPPTAAPTGVSALPNDRAATVWFTPVSNTSPGNGGASITSYTVVITNTATSATSTFPATTSPVRVTGLTNGVLYSFQVRAENRVGPGPASAASNVVKPMGSSTVTLAALPTKVVAGTIIKLSGKLTRTDTSIAAAQVVLKVRYDSGKVATLARVTPTSTGAWAYSVKAVYNLYYSATYPGDTRNTSSASSYRRVLAAARVSASAPSGSHTVNQVITGSVYPNKGGKTVVLYRVTSTGSLVRLATATLSTTSTYRFSVRLARGYTTLRVAIGATPNNVAGYRQFRAYRT